MKIYCDGYLTLVFKQKKKIVFSSCLWKVRLERFKAREGIDVWDALCSSDGGTTGPEDGLQEPTTHKMMGPQSYSCRN